MPLMSDFKARDVNGRLVLDEATDLPEGTEVPLVPADDWNALDDEDRAALETALARAAAQMQAGRGVPAEDVLRSLRQP
jgi:hypothetical protein